MKSLKTFIVISGLLILFVGNIGVNVFKHICQEDGIWTSYFVKTSEDHCLDQNEELEHATLCCSVEKEEKDNDCCQDQTEYYKINLDFYNDPSIIVPVTGDYVAPSSFVFVLQDTQEDYYTTKYVNPPPTLSGKDILIKHQVFII